MEQIASRNVIASNKSFVIVFLAHALLVVQLVGVDRRVNIVRNLTVIFVFQLCLITIRLKLSKIIKANCCIVV